MNLDEIINKRYSVRKFKSDEIPKDLIKNLINSARLAPTARNIQSQKYYIVESNEIKEKFKENQVFKKDFIYEAPTIIICTSDPTKYPDSSEKSMEFAIVDCSIASVFLILKAVELGLGTCYIGLLDKDKIREILNIPQQEIILFALPVGYPDIEQEERKRKPLEEFYKIL